MSNMTKQIIKVASEIAQNVAQQMRFATLDAESHPSEFDLLNMHNRAFRAAIEVLAEHPEFFDPDFAPITVDLGMFPPKPADHPNIFQVSCGDLVKYSTRQRSTDCFTVGQNYCVVNLSMDVVETTTDEGGIYQHARSEFFRRFDPAPQSKPNTDIMEDDYFKKEHMLQPFVSGDTPASRIVDKPDVMLFTKADIESGKHDSAKVWPEYCNVWLSPVDGKPHFVDADGWIHARGYMPVTGDALVQHPDTLKIVRADYFNWVGKNPMKAFKLA